ncbi:MAG: hypothetical protein ACREL7_10650 [Longimicrobiales bacterium]
MQLNLRLNPEVVAVVLAIVFAALTAAGGLAMFTGAEAGPGLVREFTRVFDLDREGNLPALIQAMTLLTCGILLAFVAAVARQKRELGARRWAVLSGIFMYLAIDEGAGIHELSGFVVRHFVQPQGFFRFSWVIVALIFLVFFVLAYARFTFRLPPATRLRFITAGILYVGGAVGMEMIAGRYIAATRAWNSPIYFGLAMGEEALEMAGMTLMLFAILAHLRDHVPLTTLKLIWLSRSHSSGRPAPLGAPEDRVASRAVR